MWIVEHIGKPWVVGAIGPDAFDCWGLLCWAYRTQKNIELSVFTGGDVQSKHQVNSLILAGIRSGDWQKLDAPVDFCAVAMSKSRAIHHVGLYLDIDGGLVVHACDGIGVIAQDLSQLKGAGWSTIHFYQHRSLES